MVSAMGSAERKLSQKLKIWGVFILSITCFLLGKFWGDLGFYGSVFKKVDLMSSYGPAFHFVNRTEETVIRFMKKFGNSTSSSLEGFKGEKIGICGLHFTNYVPCRDHFDKLEWVLLYGKNDTEGRRCPDESRVWFCSVPAPSKYKKPVRWPESLKEVRVRNIPHLELVIDGRIKDYFVVSGDKLKILENGEHDKYLELLPNLQEMRTCLEVGHGFNGMGVALLSRKATNLLVAPYKVHGFQVQLALERGIPAMIANFGAQRLPYPSLAFDLIYCLNCTVDWNTHGDNFLIEANRVMRPGGYFLLKMEPLISNEESWKAVLKLASQMCWSIEDRKEDLMLWRKPVTNDCYNNRPNGSQPLLCHPSSDMDDVWHVEVTNCIPLLPEHIEEIRYNVPRDLSFVPKRMSGIGFDMHIGKAETFKSEAKYWQLVVDSYFQHLGWGQLEYRNVMDMRAGFGRFAVSLSTKSSESWVMNVVPTSGPNTLPIIYDQGLIGVVHDWCEAFDTFPRTYDLLHAAGVFSLEYKRCGVILILLEMDRILRPGGRAFIRDTISVLSEVETAAQYIGWRTLMVEAKEGVYGKTWVLIGEKLPPLHESS